MQEGLENEWNDIAKVAEMGYNTLMNDDDTMVTGYKNKMQVA